jgi:hypothetical protein
MRILAAVALIALLASPAVAQPPGAVPPQELDHEQPLPQARAEHRLPPLAPVKRKDPAVGVGLAILGTLGSFALASTVTDEGNLLPAFTVLVLGPSVGQWYSRQIGGIGITARLAASYLIVRAFQTYEYDDGSSETANRMILGGLGLWIGSTLYDWYAAHDAATTYNREHSVQFAPTLVQSAKGAAPGVAASLRF